MTVKEMKCGTCGETDEAALEVDGARIRCGSCHEVETRFADYLARGGVRALAFVTAAVKKRLEKPDGDEIYKGAHAAVFGAQGAQGAPRGPS